MTTVHHDRVVKVADLLDAPGASRRVQLALPAPVDFAVPLVTLRPPVRLGGVIESVVDGLLVRGELAVEVEASCARCLAPISEQVVAEVAELFHDPARVDVQDLAELDEGYEIGDGHIDLDALLRDALAPALPWRPLCREDCRGLCAQCGIDRNTGGCDCRDAPQDGRWAALEGLRLADARDDTATELS
jgi:uncharacterized protein